MPTGRRRRHLAVRKQPFPRGRKPASAQVTAPAQAAELIDRLRAADVTLIYDPATRTDTNNSLAVTVG